MARWQAGTEDHGAFLGRIVDIGAELFAISATVVYTQTALRDHPERAAETQELAKAFCNQAQHRTERLFHELWDNADAPNHRLALNVVKGRHTWLEEGIIDPSAGDGPMVPSTETDRGISGSRSPRGDCRLQLLSIYHDRPVEVAPARHPSARSSCAGPVTWVTWPTGSEA